MYFFPRFAGNEGPTGIPGPVGPSGPKGERGAEGQALSGVTYNRGGRTNCSGDASVVYTGMRITRNSYFEKGCLKKSTRQSRKVLQRSLKDCLERSWTYVWEC